MTERAQWGSSIEFILTVIGYAVGLGSVWRFPYLVFKHGGAPFLIPFFIMLFLVGIPIFFLETAIGQFSGLSPTHVFAEMVPIFMGVGYTAVIINAFVGFYYNIIIAYCFYYLLFSFQYPLPWSECKPEYKNCFKCDFENNLTNCSAQKNDYLISNNLTYADSPSEVYFYNIVSEVSDGIQNLGHIQWRLALCLAICWTIVFLALLKGVASLGKVSYITATFPYVILTALVIKGALLEGADKGVEFYIASFNSTKLGDFGMWRDAISQVFFILSACSGGLISMASFSDFNNNLVRDTFLVPLLDCFTGVYAGFAIFSVLGNMYITKGASDFKEVAAEGPELAFVVYPEGISLMGTAAPYFSVLFFVMMLLLGFGSEFSIMEAILSTIRDVFHHQIKTKKQNIILRFCIILVYFGTGLILVTQGGFYVLTLVENYVTTYPLLVVGLLQCIVVPWIYGTRKLIKDIEQMIGKKSRYFWLIWVISWNFITPILLLTVLIASALEEGKKDRLSYNKVPFPDYAISIGYVLMGLPLSAIPICAVCKIYQFRNNLSNLFKPQEKYYARSNKKSQIKTSEIVEDEAGVQKMKQLAEDMVQVKVAELNKAYVEESEMTQF